MQSLDTQIDGLIKRAGFAVICIGPESGVPPFAYSVGLTETYGSPELLIFGVGDKVAIPVFHAVVDRIKGGERFPNGAVLEKVLNVPCVIKAVSDSIARKYALNVLKRYEGAATSPTFQQIVYPDQAGVLPWEAGYSEKMRQIQTELWTSTH